MESQKELADGNNSLSSFIQDVALLTDMDTDDDSTNDRVALMTVHSAKGLEFPTVYIAGMEEDLFPSMMSTDSRESVEEERRLFYVALTRAEKRAILTYASQRYRWGKLTDGELSRFVDEIDDKYLDLGVESTAASRVSHILDASIFRGDSHIVARGAVADSYSGFSHRQNTIPVRKKSSSSIDPSRLRRITDVTGNTSSPSQEVSLSIGQRVRHERFGIGEVLSLEGSGGDAKAIIRFEDVGEKKMLLKFAKIQKI